jgi:hypothetical protein
LQYELPEERVTVDAVLALADRIENEIQVCMEHSQISLLTHSHPLLLEMARVVWMMFSGCALPHLPGMMLPLAILLACKALHRRCKYPRALLPALVAPRHRRVALLPARS